MSTPNFNIINLSLTVKRKEYLTPHYIRIFLTGEGLQQITNTTIGVNNKILIPPKNVNKIHFPEMDYQTFRWKPQPASIKPVIRTFTHRGYDPVKNEIWIDFVAHGKNSPASRWAIEAQQGSILGVLMNDGKTELYSKAGNYFFVGDATAIPVIATILEDLQETSKGICILEVQEKEDEQNLKTKATIQFVWVHNNHPQEGSKLAETVMRQQLPDHNRFAYVAGEQASVKEIRKYLRKEKKWGRDEFYAYAYWKSGISEDRSEIERYTEAVKIQD